ncbi:MAG: response regulator transcription factor [Myxococcales bacterium]|nr:response regulator transcription factor [Myxococcales bacterium]
MHETVLIVDDDTKLTAMLSSYLSAEGFRVHCEDRGARGVARFMEEPSDIVLLDVMLPDTNGFEICRTLREKSAVPIIMLTARGDEMDRVVGLEIGADDYVPKPFSPRELVARMRAVLRRGRGESEATDPWLRLGDLRIDLVGRRLEKRGQELELTARQFDILRVLVERRGRVQTRAMLMEAVTGEPLDEFDRSIDVHVSRVRAAIEDDPKHPQYLKSIRGAGYVFAAPEKT